MRQICLTKDVIVSRAWVIYYESGPFQRTKSFTWDALYVDRHPNSILCWPDFELLYELDESFWCSESVILVILTLQQYSMARTRGTTVNYGPEAIEYMFPSIGRSDPMPGTNGILSVWTDLVVEIGLNIFTMMFRSRIYLVSGWTNFKHITCKPKIDMICCIQIAPEINFIKTSSVGSD